MKPVRLAFHKGYKHMNGKNYKREHNQREKIAKSKSAENNVYENYAGLTWGGETFSKGEMAGYKALFGAYLKSYNKKRDDERHPERRMNVKQYYEKHPPEETLLYLGNMDNNAGSEVLLEVFHEYREWLNKECVNEDEGCGIELLNAALHMDEATPHIHFRQIYYYTDKDGNFQISQNKALAGLGYERPDPATKSSKTNNAKVTFTAISREKLIEIAKSHGVELITEPLPKKESGKTLDEYKAREQMREERKQWETEMGAEQAAMEQEFQEREKALCVETENAKQAIQAERAELRAETEKSKAEIHQNEEILRDQRQEIDNMREYIAFKRAKADERAKQEAEKVREEREELAQKLREDIERAASAEKIVSRQNPQIAVEEENAREEVQNVPETPETVSAYPDTHKAQKPFNGSYTHLEHTKAELENSNTITAEEAAALLQLL